MLPLMLVTVATAVFYVSKWLTCRKDLPRGMPPMPAVLNHDMYIPVGIEDDILQKSDFYRLEHTLITTSKDFLSIHTSRSKRLYFKHCCEVFGEPFVFSDQLNTYVK